MSSGSVSDNDRQEHGWLDVIAADGDGNDRATSKSKAEATEALFHAYAARFRGYFQRRGVSAAEAEELCQDCFIKILRSAPKAAPISQPRAWLWSVASSVLADHFRSDRPTVEMEARHEPATERDQLADDSALQRCVDRQFQAYALEHPEGAQVIVWASVDQMTAPEIGELIGRTPEATRQFLVGVRKKVRAFLSVCRDYLD